MASTLRPYICQYQADEPRAKTVAPMGRALFLSVEEAPSVEVEAARYIIQFVSHAVNLCSDTARSHDGAHRGRIGARGRCRAGEGVQEAYRRGSAGGIAGRVAGGARRAQG